MRTDLPLKLVIEARGDDLLPLFGVPGARLLAVESRELPASGTRLDTLLRVRSPQGQEYLHIIEWQGYRDPTVLWRLASYVAWFGQQSPDVTVLGTVVYLAPAYDMGDSLQQVVDGKVVQQWQLQAVRLWQYDAAQAVASGKPGLATLSPLMQNATPQLVEATLQLVLQGTPPTQQETLIGALMVFAEPLMSTETLIKIIGREQMLESKLIRTLLADREQELLEKVEREVAQREAERQQREAELQQREAELQQREAEWQQREAERQQREQEQREQELREQVEREVAQREAEWQQREQLATTHQALEDVLLARFPTISFALVQRVRQVTDVAQVRRLLVEVVRAPDLAAFEQQVNAVVAANDEERGMSNA